MLLRTALWALCIVAAAPAAAEDRAGVLARDMKALAGMLSGVWDNQEQAYFSETTGETDGRMALRIEPREDGSFHAVKLDEEGRPLAGSESVFSLAVAATDDAIRQTISAAGAEASCSVLWRREAEHFVVQPGSDCTADPAGLASARVVTSRSLTVGDARLRKARPFSCWVAIPKQSGDDQWHFERNLPIHDQGGRVWVTTDEAEPQRVGLKMRNVVWPSGRNRDSLVLYVYRAEDTERAASYTWTEPEGTRLAINLRWMQASCTLADAFPPL